MIKKLLRVAFVIIGSGLYGMQQEIQNDPSAYLHSIVAHDYTGKIDAHNKHYFRRQKVQLIKLVEKGNSTFSKLLAREFANEETQRWMEWVEYQEEVRLKMYHALEKEKSAHGGKFRGTLTPSEIILHARQ